MSETAFDPPERLGSLCLGLHHDIRVLSGVPDDAIGSVKIRLRHGHIAEAFVRRPDRVDRHRIYQNPPFGYMLGKPIATNLRVPLTHTDA
ncbi:MAG TPA: hypothetical protein VHF69_11625 [Candidatus Synoicihabitans sp.]|nr:hypothetical protein [Candidatus Synoicihabitans sp.]